MQRLILKSFHSPGDIVMLSAAVRDLHAAHPGRYQTDVRTSADAIWQHNPHLTLLRERDTGVVSLDMHYPLIHQSNQRPYHFLHGYLQFLEQQLDVRIPATRFQGDIYLSREEKETPTHAGSRSHARQSLGLPLPKEKKTPTHAAELPEQFWIVVAGGKYDFTAKWWNPASYQAVVDHFRDRITFVQCGEAEHWHPRLSGVVDLVGKTNLRAFIRLVYHAQGVLCPVTLAMHLAAAVESKPGQPPLRPCVVVAGGREPAHWEAYPNHQFISTNGALPCSTRGGCWKSRCQLVGDGDPKDRRDLCEQPIQVSDGLRIPQCLAMITPDEVIRRIELYELMIGVDSGPLHVAGATTTPTLGVWTRHHPLHYFGHADHVTHLVPAAHESLLRGDRRANRFITLHSLLATSHFPLATHRGFISAHRSTREPTFCASCWNFIPACRFGSAEGRKSPARPWANGTGCIVKARSVSANCCGWESVANPTCRSGRGRKR